MGASSSSSSSSIEHAEVEKNFLVPTLKKGKEEKFLQKIGEVALKHRGSQIQLQHEEGKVCLKVGTLEETSYSNKAKMFEEWEQVYLPDHMFMEVIGVLQKFPCVFTNNELVLMVCEDGKVFVYEDHYNCPTLHMVSNSLEELFNAGLKFPGIKQYYRGQSFENMTAVERERLRETEEFKKMIKEQEEYWKEHKESFLEHLDSLARKRAAGECKW